MGGGTSSARQIFRRSVKEFSTNDRDLLCRMFEDLSSHSTSRVPGIDKVTFLRIFKQPGMLGERLFAVFDRNKDGYIDQTEFLSGLATVVHGSKEEKINFIFEMYDLNNDGGISRTELSTMLNCAICGNRFLLTQSEIETNVGAGSDSGMSESEIAEEAMSQHVEDLIRSAFPDSETDKNNGRLLTKAQFTEFVEQNLEILDMIDQTFMLHDYASGSEDEDTSNFEKRPGKPDRSIPTNLMRKSSSIPRHLSAIFGGKLFLDVNGKQILRHRQLIGEIITPDHVKQKFRHDHSRPLEYQCNSCSFLISIMFCYYCGTRTTSMECSRCGKNIIGKIIFCPSCGVKACFISLTIPDTDEQKSSGKFQSAYRSQSVPGSRRSSHFAVEQQNVNISNQSAISRQKPTESFDPFHQLYQHHYHHHAIMRGHLYKIGKRLQHLTERYFILRDSFLYQFRRFDDLKPHHTSWLEGCIVRAVNHEDQQKKMR